VPESTGVRHEPPKNWGYLVVLFLSDAFGMAVAAALSLQSLRQPHAVLSATVSGLLWFLVRAVRRRYHPQLLRDNFQLGRLVIDWLIFVTVCNMALMPLRTHAVFNVVVVSFVPGFLCTCMTEASLRELVLAKARAAIGVYRVLVVGEPAVVEHAVNRLASSTDHPFGVVGTVSVGDDMPTSGTPIVGRLPKRASSDFHADAGTILLSAADTEADLVLLAQGSDLMGRRLRRVIWSLQDARVPVATLTPPEDVATHRLLMRHAGGLSIFHVLPPAGPFKEALKSLLDKCVALLGLVISAPLLLVIGLAIWSDSRGPVVYHQERVGKNGRPFIMYKFRTMVHMASGADVPEMGNEAAGSIFKARRDPRVTRVGGFLRRSSLDELPQLFNVLRGDMSLVGPRPPLPDEAARYDETELRRLKVKPGMTGIWQVSGRSQLTRDESLKLDLYYVDNWSIASYFRILARTLPAVVDGRGAY
jgi:exopolysaccharide biosynthesis polyprenyl glycosylphosphotransferase